MLKAEVATFDTLINVKLRTNKKAQHFKFKTFSALKLSQYFFSFNLIKLICITKWVISYSLGL